IFFPRRWGILRIPELVIPTLLGFAYAGLIVPAFFTSDGGGYSSIEAVRTLLSSDGALTAGWLHYLAFDLFVGAWIARTADKAGIPRVLQAVFLLATFMFGPVGFVLFVTTRSFMAAAPFAKRGENA
ncbi:MAG: ABA4-like family protein, partial [Pseudomonadota bacterium]